ncbi:MAG: MBL fold metallo-hydrolase [Haliangiales bacterium]
MAYILTMRTRRLVTRIALLGLGLLLAGLSWSFVKRPLPVPDTPGVALPPNPKPAGVSLAVIPTAEIQSRAGFSVRGGALGSSFTSAIVAFLIEHPKGSILVDAGAGRDLRAHLATTPWLLQTFTELSLNQATIDALAAGGVEPSALREVWLTHSHWDHVSGLADFGDQVPIWLAAEELTHARSDDAGALFQQIEANVALRIGTQPLSDGVYGPFPSSRDYFGDGSVIALPLSGHTPGSIAVLVNLGSGRRYLLIGDTAWAREGVDWPAEKPLLSRAMVDADPERVRDQLVSLHQLQAANPELVIVPAHDARVHSQMATFPARER